MDKFEKQYIPINSLINLVFYNDKNKLLEMLEKNKNTDKYYVIYFIGEKNKQMTPIVNITDDFLIFFKKIINVDEKKIDLNKLDLNKLLDGIYHVNRYDELSFKFLDTYIKFSLFIL
jgi:hypothetical protein